MEKRNFTILFIACICTFSVMGQVKIKGKVLDDRKETIIGASVIEKGTRNGTVTDIDGNFSLTISGPEASLEVSYVGMKSQTVALNGRSDISIVLESSSIELQEVVAVGYGTMRKSDMTGSVSSVKVKDTETVPVVSVDQMLKGKSSGVYVNTGSAEPGGVSTVKIRGVNSLSADNEPLYVVDGVAMDNVGGGVNPFGATNPQQRTNPLTYLSPQDIVNIEVLKDASATAIFGSRGSNGVILITTKSGESGTLKVNITSSLNISQIRKKIDMLSGPDYARYRNEVRLRNGEVILYGNTEATRPENLNWIDWQDAVIQTGISQNSRISVSGGTKTSNFYLSAGYDTNEGIIKNTFFNRGDLRFNYSTDLSKAIKLDFNIAAADINSKMTQTTGAGGSTNYSAIRSMISKTPILTFVTDATNDVESTLNLPTSWVNDYADDNAESNLSGKLGITFKLSKLFKYEVKASYNFKQSERFRYYDRTLSPGANGGAAGFSSMRYTGINIDNLVHFEVPINADNRLSGVVGTTYSSSEFRTLANAVSGFPDDVLGYEQYGSASVNGPLNKNRSIVLLNSYLARVNYSLYNKYMLTISARADGSSKFATGNKYSIFPSAALAWRMKEESFLKDVENISNLKLRLGWGLTGNQGIAAYATQERFGDPSHTYMYSFGGSNTLALPLYTLGNKDLKWETSEQLNAGLDIGLWNEKLSMSIDIYRKLNSDMLIRKVLPPTAGLISESTLVNFGAIENKGADFNINYIIFDKKLFKWSVDANISVYRNKILELGLPLSEYGLVQYNGAKIHPIGELQQPANTFIEGQPAGLFWGYKTAGIFQNQAEINAFTALNTSATNIGTYYFNRAAKPGDIIYVDNNLDGIISTLDYQIIGNPNPDFTYGFNTNMSYKNIALNVGLIGVQGKDIFNANLNREDQMTGGYYNIRRDAWDGRWQGDGTGNTFPAATSSTVTNVISDRLVEDASFLRLANITLSYNLKFPKNFFLKDTKFFITGNNLCTFTKYRGFDPEVDSFAGDPMRIGIDNNSYPSSKSYIFGMNINF